MNLPLRPASQPVYRPGCGRCYLFTFTVGAGGVRPDARRHRVGNCPGPAARRAARSRGWWASRVTSLARRVAGQPLSRARERGEDAAADQPRCLRRPLRSSSPFERAPRPPTTCQTAKPWSGAEPQPPSQPAPGLCANCPRHKRCASDRAERAAPPLFEKLQLHLPSTEYRFSIAMARTATQALRRLRRTHLFQRERWAAALRWS